MAGIIKANHRAGNQRGTQSTASRIIGGAPDQAEHVRQMAAQCGQDEARKSTEPTVLNQFDERLQSLEQMIEAIQREKTGWFKEWEANVVHLAVAIAERVIRRKLPEHPEITLDWIREALELAASGERIRLHLNPHDIEMFGEQASELSRRISGLAPSEIVADSAVSIGGCVVKTEFGQIDQRIESQLKRIEEELAG